MNINNFQTSFEYVSFSGHVLSTEKCVLLKNTMTILQNENHFKEIFLWGKILGLQQDYWIAYGYEKDMLYGRVFYYSVDCVNWGLLPRSTAEFRTLALTCTKRFQGDPAYVEDLSRDKDVPVTWNEEEPVLRPPAAGGDAPSSAPSAAQPPSLPGGATIKEENRLAAVVELITEEAAVLPRGALARRHDGYVVGNPGFSGLSPVDAVQLRSYFHYRPPLHKWNTNLLAAEDNYNFSVDFLDTIDRDIPDGRCWSQQFKSGGAVVLLRNLYWPGATFYHRLRTQEHGFLYVGEARREVDILFMM